LGVVSVGRKRNYKHKGEVPRGREVEKGKNLKGT